MRKIFTKITSLALALLVLFSTMSFKVEKHFCGDFLVDISYFGNADSCGAKTELGCDNPTSIKKKSCCKDEIHKIEGQDEIRKSSDDNLNFKTKNVIAIFVVSYVNLFKKLHNKIVPHKNYFPPNLTLNFQVLYETFIL